MAPQLEQVFILRAVLSKDGGLNLGATKGGNHRFVAPISGGFIKGSGVDMEVLPGGADWFKLDPTTGTAHLDVRLQARDKTTGASLYACYPGVLKVDGAVKKCLAFDPEAKTTESKDHYFFCTPVFEVSDEKLKWLEQNVFLAHGHFSVAADGETAVEYEVYTAVSA